MKTQTFDPSPYSRVYCSIGISSTKRNVILAPEIFELMIANFLAKSGFDVAYKPAASFAE